MSKILVAYFSASGVTAGAARKIAEAVGADLFEIRPEGPYTAADLDWRNKKSRSSLEMTDPDSRPAMAAAPAPDMARYDTVFVGFPIWWGVEPRVVDTFLESRDLTGKTVITFATSGGSGLGKSASGLRSSAPGAKIMDGRMLNGRLNEAELKAWAEGLKL